MHLHEPKLQTFVSTSSSSRFSVSFSRLASSSSSFSTWNIQKFSMFFLPNAHANARTSASSTGEAMFGTVHVTLYQPGSQVTLGVRCQPSSWNQVNWVCLSVRPSLCWRFLLMFLCRSRGSDLECGVSSRTAVPTTGCSGSRRVRTGNHPVTGSSLNYLPALYLFLTVAQ